jgi:hypothetical protein
MGQRYFSAKVTILVLVCFLFVGLSMASTSVPAQSSNEQMTEEKALTLAEQFGVEVGEVDEEIQEVLGLTKAGRPQNCQV